LHMSCEDQPVDRTFGDYQDEAGLLPSPSTVQNGEGSAPVLLPGAATQPDAPTELLPTRAVSPSPAGGDPDAMESIDPFALWAATSGKPLTSSPAPETATQRPPERRAKSDPRSRPRPAQQDRRKLVTLLAVGAAGVLGVSSVGGISFAHFVKSVKESPWRLDDDRSDGSNSIHPHREKDDGGWGRQRRRPHKRPTPSDPPTPQASSSQTPTSTPTQQPAPTPAPTQQPTPTSTQQPTPTPTPTQQPTPTPMPMPTGTVIGSTSQATNTAVSFTNPADSQGSFLIHLGNGNWVAGERSCTHQGAWVNYDPTSGHLVCPAHGAIFDPANAFSVLQGPAMKPLPAVPIHVNANGTVTTP
jgi:Rieske Fe-S protein